LDHLLVLMSDRLLVPMLGHWLDQMLVLMLVHWLVPMLDPK
jgi:hypothetical protein